MKIFIKYSIIVLFFLTANVYSSDEKIGRSFIDLADIDDGYNIHVMYVIPIDGVDKEYDLNSKISMLLYQIDKSHRYKTVLKYFACSFPLHTKMLLLVISFFYLF